MFGRSPRMYASKVRLRTVAQSRSRLSSMILSTHSSGSVSGFAAARAALSPAEKFGPRSGQFREGSNGFHLSTQDQLCKKLDYEKHRPKVMEMIRICTTEEAFKAEGLWCCTILCGRIKKVSKPIACDQQSQHSCGTTLLTR